MPEQRCIYCSRDRPNEILAEKFFTTEHVIPQAFGRFMNNLTIPEGVCGDCNKYFGETLDFILGRGSPEAVLRFDYGIKPAYKANEIKKDRIDFKLQTDDEFNGLRVVQGINQDGTLSVLCVPQIGFIRLDGKGRIYLTAEELQDASLSLSKIDKTKNVILVFNSDEVKEQLIDLLKNHGITSHETIEEDLLTVQADKMADVVIQAVVDDNLLRAHAKIAFNYMAAILGVDFALRTNFDSIRRYIRFGTIPDYIPVKIRQQSILDPRSLITNGHLITLDWSPDGRDLRGDVSLFNFGSYRITLAHNYSGILQIIRSGHHFDITTRQVKLLRSLPRYLMP